jgi:hypothetical protein
MINLGERLLQERASNYKGGLYHLTQLELAYNSNRIEGSSFTEEQTMYLYDTQAVFFGDNDFVKKDDVIEMNNHFILFNHMLDTYKDTTRRKGTELMSCLETKGDARRDERGRS